MSDIGEGLGTAVEGGLIARALNPHSGAKERHHDDPEDCLNCGTALVGAYCHACGQSGHVHRTLGAILHDLLHGALHFEGRMWRTLPMLAVRPGRLTRRYIDGARARFVSPMALFLFSVFLMFATFQVLGADGLSGADVNSGIRDNVAEEIDREIRESREFVEAGIASQTGAGDTIGSEDEIADAEIVEEDIDPVIETGDGTTGIDFIDKGIIEKWQSNPELMVYKLQANSYKFSWLLIPLSIPFVWLMFVWKRRFKAYDHAIFVTYSLSFMTLLFVTVSVLGAVGLGANWQVTILATLAPWHLYRDLRGTYELSRFSAVWRLLTLLVFITVIAALFLQILLVLGAF